MQLFLYFILKKTRYSVCFLLNQYYYLQFVLFFMWYFAGLPTCICVQQHRVINCSFLSLQNAFLKQTKCSLVGWVFFVFFLKDFNTSPKKPRFVYFKNSLYQILHFIKIYGPFPRQFSFLYVRLIFTEELISAFLFLAH